MPRSSPRLRGAGGSRNEIGPRLKARRKALKLTQDALCARLAVVTEGGWIADLQEIPRIESGVRIVADLEVLALARALKCNPCFLLTGEGEVASADQSSQSAESPSDGTQKVVAFDQTP